MSHCPTLLIMWWSNNLQLPRESAKPGLTSGCRDLGGWWRSPWEALAPVSGVSLKLLLVSRANGQEKKLITKPGRVEISWNLSAPPHRNLTHLKQFDFKGILATISFTPSKSHTNFSLNFKPFLLATCYRIKPP